MKTNFALGDIVLIPFPFSDLSKNKIRPAVVLAQDKDDFVCMFITTSRPEGGYFLDVVCDKNNNLKMNSYIRYSKIASLSNKIIIGKLGKLSNKDFTLLKSSVKKFLGI
ncbi:type II toxin-antitoxin system PemK/MazF family toxin [Candidatus Gracilibacteria bacterium]|nr:type II toxin-antitoxin system PemK/MazF family toxin [Candidatus Gracilibacteria bacterium]MCF7898850.1 type II toxin-antitoxin system PemK/MazF family toxin [Candidatus Paceibacterota bacterium]